MIKKVELNKLDITHVSNAIDIILNDTAGDKREVKTISLINNIIAQYTSKAKIKKVEYMVSLIKRYSDIDNFELGSRVNFNAGTKCYYDIKDKQKALEKALNDKFIDSEIVEIIPYWGIESYKVLGV